jgi:hypothetical protein
MRRLRVLALIVLAAGAGALGQSDGPGFLLRAIPQPAVILHPPSTPPSPAMAPFQHVLARSLPPVPAASPLPVVHLAPAPRAPAQGPLFLDLLRKKARAEGDFNFTNGALDAFFSFNADAITQSGEAFYTDFNAPGGQRWYRVRVTAVEIHGNECTFSGPIVETDLSDWPGLSIQFWATDRGNNNDTFAYRCYEGDAELPFDEIQVLNTRSTTASSKSASSAAAGPRVRLRPCALWLFGDG